MQASENIVKVMRLFLWSFARKELAGIRTTILFDSLWRAYLKRICSDLNTISFSMQVYTSRQIQGNPLKIESETNFIASIISSLIVINPACCSGITYRLQCSFENRRARVWTPFKTRRFFTESIFPCMLFKIVCKLKKKQHLNACVR